MSTSPGLLSLSSQGSYFWSQAINQQIIHLGSRWYQNQEYLDSGWALGGPRDPLRTAFRLRADAI